MSQVSNLATINAYTKSNSIIMKGKTKLQGSVSVQGSKNAALPLLSALPLVPEAEFYNIPDLSDIYVMLDILEYLGSTYTFEKGVLRINNENLQNKTIDNDFSSKMRASSLFLGPLLAKFGQSSVGMPGGCVIGSRPLDIHLDGFEMLGATTDVTNGNVYVESEKIEGTYTLPYPSVGATQNLISSAVFSSSEVVLHNIAIEPEVVELIDFLNAAGAKIKFIDGKSIRIKGVKKLRKVSFTVQPDRIEAFTLLVAAVATKGSIKITDCRPEHLTAPIQALVQMGVDVSVGRDYVKARYVGPLDGIKVQTDVYPGFPTDCQQQLSILMTMAETPSIIVENVFNNRLRHLDELRKAGLDVEIENNVAVIKPSQLTGCRLDSFDLRGAASMIISGLIAEGVTIVDGLQYLHRGYECYIEKLNHLGSDISYKS